MPTLDRIATSSVSPDAHVARLEGVGVYLTNEVFLYRVIEVLPSEEGEMVELEDCYGLDVVRVPLAEVNMRRLRLVTPSSVHG